MQGQDSLRDLTYRRVGVLRDLLDGRTLATVEASIGGSLAAALTEQPGASAFFVGGLVPYAGSVKCRVLGIPDGLFREHGSVSAEAASAMAEAGQRTFAADFCVAETSILGPSGGTPEKPVGLSYLALVGRSGPTVHRATYTGGRDAIRRAILLDALDRLIATLQ